MKKESQINFRIDAESRDRLERVAGECGLTVSSLVRVIAAQFLRESAATGYRIRVPPGLDGARLAAEDQGTYETASRPVEGQ